MSGFSPDTLRRAAALMRERAEAATSGPWESETDEAPTGPLHLIASLGGPYFGEVQRGPDAEHIASWHPAVALAVADWLDTVARLTVEGDAGGPLLQERALAVARAYLGESA